MQDEHTQKSILNNADTTRVSISEARRLMGPSGRGLSDEEVQRLIYDLTAIVRAYMRSEMVPQFKE